MVSKEVPEYVKASEIVIIKIQSLGLVSYQGIDIIIPGDEPVTINGLGETEDMARTNFLTEWKNRSIELFGVYVPVLSNCKKIRKTA